MRTTTYVTMIAIGANGGVVVRSTVIDDVHGIYNDNRIMKMNTINNENMIRKNKVFESKKWK